MPSRSILTTKGLSCSLVECSFYTHRSSALLELGRFKDAEEDGHKAVELSPKWARAYYCLGMAYLKQGLYVDAASTFYQGCELAPTNKELSMKFREALEVGRREHQKEVMEAKERVKE